MRRPPVTLLMAIHCHQPVGNFGFVIEEAYAKAYDPFLRVLERHPGVRLALHYSGCLLDWLTAHRPEFLDRVRALASRGQVELLASGYYEPILPLLPEADRQGQIARMRAAVRASCGAEAAGFWLTERVWEPDLAATLARAGIRYTMVDTNQFATARAWLPEWLQVQDEVFWDLLGCYVTEYAGASLVLFPASKRLRYWMPFQPVGQTINFLKRLRRDEPAAVTFADDGEKFGLWPKTHHWVYEEGWLEQFFAALERERAWLSTTTFQDYLEDARPDGRVWLPCGSYDEMLEWSGGNFRNFFAKYPEANAMQQKMLRVSEALHATADGSRRAASGLLRQATEELYAGQCNCAYWHGVFGGLYLSHLRRAVYAHLIAAEGLLNRLTHEAGIAARDADGDGQDELSLKTASMHLVIDPDEGGALTEWDLYASRINLLDTLSRRPEPYHAKLKAKPVPVAAGVGAPPSIHDVVGIKDPDLKSRVVYDDHRRSAFLDYALQGMPTLEEAAHSAWGERRLWSPGPFRVEGARRRGGASGRSAGPWTVTMVREIAGGRILKAVRVERDRPHLECRYTLDGLDVPVVGLEFNVSVRDERYLTAMGQRAGVTAFELGEPAVGVSLALAIDPPATLFRFPIETVSESEGGLERTYQGLCLVLLWAPARSHAGAARAGTLARAWTCRVRWSVVTGPPHAPRRPAAGRPARR